MSRGLLGNIAKRAQQFNLLGEKRISEGKKGEKMRRREGKMKMRGWKGGRKRETEKEKHKSKDK